MTPIPPPAPLINTAEPYVNNKSVEEHFPLTTGQFERLSVEKQVDKGPSSIKVAGE